MTEQLTRPPSLRTFLEAGCDVTTIPDLENYARIIIIGQAMPWQDRARLALAYDDTAEAWLAGEDASPFGPDVELEATPGTLRHYLWLAEGLMEPGVAVLFERALPDEVRAMCNRRIIELVEAGDGEAVSPMDDMGFDDFDDFDH